jgi:peptidoglycan/LPS O-acetylase OafA/YrhL
MGKLPPARVDARRRLDAIDVLRAVAALAVLFGHVPHAIDGTGFGVRQAVLLPLDLGYLGVPLFLVISGFCIHLAAAGRLAAGAGVSWARFWRRRFFRLYPPYFIACVLSLALYLGLGAAAYADHERVADVLWDAVTHLLLVHNLFRDYATGLGNGPFWTLGLEEQLYALYFVYLMLRRRFAPRSLLPWALLLAVAWRWGVPAAWAAAGVADPHDQILGFGPLRLGGWGYWPPAHWFAWLLGAAAAEAYVGVIPLPPAWTNRRTAALCFLVAATLCPPVMTRFSGSAWLRGHAEPWAVSLLGALVHAADPAFALGCFVVLNRWVRSEVGGNFPRRLLRPLAAVGAVSYSLYLTHAPVLHLLEHLLAPGRSAGAILFRYAVYPPVCVAFGFGFFYLVERHFLNRPRAAGLKGKGDRDG